jgi:aryl-alcohol dehydrogenase-like predicted oxidoreductase
MFTPTHQAPHRIALGCGTFGGIGTELELLGRGLTEEAAYATVDEALALGITFFDTAHGYAGGASETIIGRWLAQQSSAVRAGIRIATKVGIVHGNDARRIDLSPSCISEQLDISLDRLGVECVDLCLTHVPDPKTPIEATLEGLASAIASKRAKYIGACNVDAKQVREAIAASTRLGLPRYHCIQNEYNLIKRDDEAGVFQACREFNIEVMSYSPIAGGKLSGKYARGRAPDADSRLALWPDSPPLSSMQFDAIERLRQEGAVQGVSAGAIAFAWVLAQPDVATVITGPSRKPEYLQVAREALSVALDAAERKVIAGWFET